MRHISYNDIVQKVSLMAAQCCYELPSDVLEALQNAHAVETNPRAKKILAQLLENAQIAKDQQIPLCQDTGLSIVFIKLGSQLLLTPPENNPNATITDAVNQGVAQGYESALLRKSVVAEPLNQRQNTRTNTPCIVHCEMTPGDKLEITLMAKGGGCENKSRFKMFNPTDTPQTVQQWIVNVVKDAGANACPPFVVGVGIGGDFEQCCYLSKKALLKPLNTQHTEQFYSDMETKLLKEINSLNLGPQGLGGDCTALAVKIETAPCHIASLPVAVNIECHSHRHKTTII